MKTSIALLTTLCGCAAACLGASDENLQATAPAESKLPDWLTRDQLTGDWFGVRTDLSNRGLDFRISFTEYYQGLLSGDGDHGFEFGGRADALIDLDTGKLGLWKGGGFHTHFETRFGDARGSLGGALWPVNTGLVLPLGEYETFCASSIYYSQGIGNASMLIGKINAVDLLASDPFYGGWGTTRFMNIAFVAPPSGVFPPVVMGGIFNYRLKPVTLTLMVYDPDDQTDNYWVDDLFANGVNVSLGATWAGQVFGRASSANLTGIYSTKDGTDLGDIALPPGLQTGTKEGSYNVSVKLSHLLYESSVRPGQGLGVYAKLGLSDGNPNPIRSFVSGGLAAHGIVPCRPLDSFGLGYYWYNFSDDLEDVLAPRFQYGNEQGIEVFYNFSVTPWCYLTADLQWLSPARTETENAVVAAFRANIRF